MPPMYRECPFWYKRNYCQISAAFTSSFRQPVGHTFVLSSYTNPVFERDGIHLTEDDGLRYVQMKFAICACSSLIIFNCISSIYT